MERWVVPPSDVAREREVLEVWVVLIGMVGDVGVIGTVSPEDDGHAGDSIAPPGTCRVPYK